MNGGRCEADKINRDSGARPRKASETVTVSPQGAPEYEFEYDANGNTLSMTNTEGGSSVETTFEWNALDRLVAINTGDHRSEFTYDGIGRRVRIREIENSVVQSDRFYLWNGMTIIASGPYSSPGISNADKLYTPFGYVYNATSSSAKTSCYYFKDHLGSVRGALSKDGMECEYDYDAYGNPTGLGSGPGESDFLYTGHFYHRPSGLYLAPYRTYNPRFGRWLSREPSGADGPNFYHYVFNDPINWIDGLGLARNKGFTSPKNLGGLGAGAGTGFGSGAACTALGLSGFPATAIGVVVGWAGGVGYNDYLYPYMLTNDTILSDVIGHFMTDPVPYTGPPVVPLPTPGGNTSSSPPVEFPTFPHASPTPQPLPTPGK